jgi:ADP-ribosylglycohydrolase
MSETIIVTEVTPVRLDRAKGCLFGQFIGDSLGSLVELQRPDSIKADYPNGVRELTDGGPYGLLAGQLTGDSEMALALARTLVKDEKYIKSNVRNAYAAWLHSDPFDAGKATVSALGLWKPIPGTEANGAMMRASPLGIWCAGRYDLHKGKDFEKVSRLALEDAAITHPSKVCADANVLYVMAITDAVRHGLSRKEIYSEICDACEKIDAAESVKKAVENAWEKPPIEEFGLHGDWVLVAFQNALYQLLHAKNFEEALVDTIDYGYDTDTNAAICGALFGAAVGFEAIPKRWRDIVAACRPSGENPRARHPRPECYWPCDAEELADLLLEQQEIAISKEDKHIVSRRKKGRCKAVMLRPEGIYTMEDCISRKFIRRLGTNERRAEFERSLGEICSHRAIIEDHLTDLTIADKEINGVDYDSQKAAELLSGAFDHILAAAKNGDTVAQSHVGMMYLTGTGLERDSAKAAKWFRKAADARQERNNEASHNLGLMYFNGDGVEQDFEKAAQYFGRGTWEFHAGSMNYLAMMYLSGEGVEQDEFRALELLDNAAQLGDRDAQYNLDALYRTLYRKGKIDEQDFKNASKWFRKSGFDERGFKTTLKWLDKVMPTS